MDKKKKTGLIIGIIVAVIVVFVLVVAIITGVVIFNLPVNRASRAINNEKFENLEQAYDKASSNSQKKIVQKCETKADKILEEYIDDKITYNEAQNKIDGISDAVGYSAALSECELSLDAIHNNKENYEKAMEAMQNGKYAVASGFFSKMTDDRDNLLNKAAADIEQCTKRMQEEIVGVWSTDIDLAASINEGDFVEGNESLHCPVTFKIELRENQTGVAIIPEESYWSGMSVYANGGYQAMVERVEATTQYKGQDAQDYIAHYYRIYNAADLYSVFLSEAPYALSTFSKQFQYKIDGNYILITDDVYDEYKMGYTMNSDGTLTLDLMGYEGFKDIFNSDMYNVFDMTKDNPLDE